MVDLELFLGTPCSEELNSLLEGGENESLAEVFIGDNPDYLQKVEVEGKFFIGKRIGKEVDLEGLSNAERNIHSLLSRLLPKYLKSSLVLFPVLAISRAGLSKEK